MNRKLFTITFLLILLALVTAACGTAAETEPVEIVETTVDEAGTADVVNTDTAEESSSSTSLTYPIVDTNQGFCYNNSELIDCPAEGEAFYGQDAQFTGLEPSYTDNGDGTINDNVTGLVWTQEISSYAMV